MTSPVAAHGSRSPRPLPPRPEPLEKPLGPIATLRAMRTNPIAAATRAHFEQPIVVTNSILGVVAIVSEPGAIRHVLVNNAENYGKDSLQQRMLDPAFKHSLLATAGEQWRKQRRVIAPHFSPRMVAKFADGVAAGAWSLIERWKQKADGDRLEIGAEMARASIEALERTLFPDGVGCTAEELHAAVTLYFGQVARLDPLDVVDAPDWVPRLGRWRARPALALFKRAATRVAAARQARLSRGEPEQPTELLAVLEKALDPRSNEGLSPSEIADNLTTFASAGYETTAATLSWSLYLLSLDAEWRGRLEAEADRELPDGRVDGSTVERLVATRAVVEESLRLYPTVPAINRQALGPDRLGGAAIPAGARVVVAPWVVHRHRRLWQAPDHFDPSRFLPGAREAIDRFAYLPFGAGPRVCVGAGFAVQEATITLATIVRWFRLELVPGHAVWPQHRATLRPRDGLPMILRHRTVAPA
jgi:cytochrome P450